MPEDTWHSEARCGQFLMLNKRYESDPNTIVGSALSIYFKGGQPAQMVTPDILVAFGVREGDRDSYMVWAEGKAPDFVLEVTSDQSLAHDLGRKKDTYERLGVREYCLYDPIGGRHWPRLQLFRLAGEVYERVSWKGSPDGPLALTSETLGLELRFDGDWLRLWDPLTGGYLFDPWEELRRFWRDRDRRIAAERRAERLKRETERLNRQADQDRRETERLNRQADQDRRETERLNRQADQDRRETERLNRQADADSLARQKLEAEIAVVKEQLRRRL